MFPQEFVVEDIGYQQQTDAATEAPVEGTRAVLGPQVLDRAPVRGTVVGLHPGLGIVDPLAGNGRADRPCQEIAIVSFRGYHRQPLRNEVAQKPKPHTV